jgi:hypothetical protein
MRVVSREIPEQMSRMFTENVCMDFDQLVRDSLNGRLHIGACYSTKYV